MHFGRKANTITVPLRQVSVCYSAVVPTYNCVSFFNSTVEYISGLVVHFAVEYGGVSFLFFPLIN